MMSIETGTGEGLQRDRDSILGKMVRVTIDQRPEDVKEHEEQMQKC